MSHADVADLLALQSGVVSRAQLIAAELAPHDIRRMERRRELSRIMTGVYLDHTGEPTWLQRAWAAVLHAAPAALCHDSALRAADGPGRRDREGSPIHVAIDRDRRLVAPRGVRFHRLGRLDERVQWNTSPPRVRMEEAVLDVALDKADETALIATLAGAVQARRTTAARVRAVLDGRPRVPRREFVGGVLDDIDQGTCSVLEHGYLHRVELPHRLPASLRQVGGTSSARSLSRDVVYGRYAQVVELDGRLFHDSAEQRDADLDRDLDAAVEKLGTVRIGWGQVFRTPCRTAHRVGALLRARGWDGHPAVCPSCPSELLRAS